MIANGVISANTSIRPIQGVLMHTVRTQKDLRAFQTQGSPQARTIIQTPQ